MASAANKASSHERHKNKKCEICLRSFSRAEHLARHLLIHTKEKPFTCPYCHKSFQRSDVKAGHVRRCRADPSNQATGAAGGADPTRKRARVACVTCRRKKVRCDGNEPCGACLHALSACSYNAPIESPLAPSTTFRAGPPTNAISDQPIGHSPISDSLNATPVDIAPHQTAHDETALSGSLDLENQLETDFNAVQGHGLSMLHPGSLERGGMSEQGNMMCDMVGMATSSENFLSHFADVGGIEDYWQLPPINTPFWFDGPDFTTGGMIDSTSPVLERTVGPSSMQNLTSSMQKYFESKSRAPSSPPLNRAGKMWYSAPPNLNDHDKDVVRVFLNIFRTHIPKTFSLFKDTTAGRKGQAAFTLAMAATGGLFCSVPGSAEVAKSMYNDARRLLLASFNVKTSDDDDDLYTTLEERLIVVKTFILLALYGLCSGDKRSYEFMESFHANLIDAVQEYSQTFQAAEMDGRREDDRVKLLEALYILDCYRIIIMQCPPSLSWHHPDSFARSPNPTGQLTHVDRLVTEILNGGRTAVSSASSEFSLASLACASVFLWPVMYPRQNRYDVDDVAVESLTLWKRDFVDLACDSWLHARGDGQAIDASHLAVYHMLNIMLHANLTVIQSFAHSAPGTPARDPTKGLAAREIHAWTRSTAFKFSRWHAEHLIATVEATFTTPTNRSEHQQPGLQPPFKQASSSSTESRQLPFEVPHVPYAVYFATLIIWCGAITEEGIGPNPLVAQAVITKGERILSLHKLHIAQLLARVLRDVR